MNSNDLITVITALSGVIEKSFTFAEANAKRRHEETMYQLETNRIVAKAEAHLKDAQASEIEARLQKADRTH
jgi:hypothetical protein